VEKDPQELQSRPKIALEGTQETEKIGNVMSVKKNEKPKKPQIGEGAWGLRPGGRKKEEMLWGSRNVSHLKSAFKVLISLSVGLRPFNSKLPKDPEFLL